MASISKQKANNTEIEYNIDNKLIVGVEKQTFEEQPDIIYYRNIEFQGKKFLPFSKKSDIIKYKKIYYYCKKHRITKGSEQMDTLGNKKRINLCNAKIKYNIAENKYSFFGKHSEECENLINSLSINYTEVKEEINNYEKFREALKNFLKQYPITTFAEFKKYGQDLYYNKKSSFPINQNLYSNLYYNWRRTSHLFSKSCIFEKQKTLDGKQFMRDYTITMLYKKNNKDLFQHEHIIFISDYFI